MTSSDRDVSENPTGESITIPMNTEGGITAEYIPSRQHPVSGSSYRHDPNQASSTIENLDDDDDDEDVYDPSKTTLFRKLPTSTQEAQASPATESNQNRANKSQHEQGKLMIY